LSVTIEALQWLSVHLPIFGVVAFSLSSVWSLYHLFVGNARHPTGLFWAPATLVELVTAWLVYNSVQMTRQVTQSKISRQDRRFYAVMLALNLALMVPTLGVSVWANKVEFQSWWLGSLFPVASIACAVAVAIPDAVKRRENHRKQERQEAEKKRKQRERERQEAEARAESERQEAETARKEKETTLESLGNAAATYQLYLETPEATQAEIAERAGISKRTVRNHLNVLEAAGLISRNGDGVHIND
jgi:DNA-binding transcriptional ArsR family regulator